MIMQTTRHRTGWLKYVLLVALALGGAAGGIYLSVPGRARKNDLPDRPKCCLSFPLSAYDAKDQIEAFPCGRPQWHGLAHMGVQNGCGGTDYFFDAINGRGQILQRSQNNRQSRCI